MGVERNKSLKPLCKRRENVRHNYRFDWTKHKKTPEGSKMSQEILAEQISIARPVISNWENGKSEPSSSQLVQLSKIFGISIDEIVGNTTHTSKIVVVDTSALIKTPFDH